MAPGNPHVALVCWGFPPFRGSGVFRPLALANHLVRAGADVTVVAASREVFLIHYGADPALEQQIDPAISVQRVPFFPDKGWPLMNDWPAERVEAPQRWAARPDPALEVFPEKVYGGWLGRLADALFDLHHRRPVDLMIATGGPYVDLAAATEIATNYAIPLVLDDRDAFVADVFTGGPHRMYRERLPHFERWLRHCREMWFVNPPIADWHRARFPEHADRIHVVENGWDPGVVVPGEIRSTGGGPLTAGYVGLVPTNFPMTALLAAWEQVRDPAHGLAELRFVGPLSYAVGSDHWNRTEEAIATTPGVHWAGHRSRPELHGVYADLDVLLLVKEGGTMVTGGKTYEYAATGLPIAALIDPGSDAARVLAGYPRLHLAASTDPADAAAAIRAAVADRMGDDGTRLAAAQAFGAGLDRGRVLQPHIDRILSAVRR